MKSDHSSSTQQSCHEHFRHVPIPTYIWTIRESTFYLTDFNNAALTFSGSKLSSLLGLTAEQIYHDRPDIIAWMQECRETQSPVERVIDLHLRTTGQLRMLQCSWIWIEPDTLLFCTHDITELKTTEQVLKESVELKTEELSTALAEIEDRERFLTQVFDSIQEGICILSPEMDILKVNKTMKAWYDFQPKFEGEKCYQIFQNQRDSTCDFCPAHKTIRDKSHNMAEVQAFRPLTDKELWFEVHTFPLLGEQNQLMGIIEFARNITEKKQLETQLIENERRFRSILENIPCLVYSFSPEKGTTYNSPSARKVLGYSIEELTSNPILWHDSIHPEDLPAVDQAIETLMPGHNRQLEYRIRDKNGDLHWFLDQFSVHETDDKGQEIHGVAIDITEKVQAEKALLASEDRYKMLSGLTFEGILLHNHGITIDVNQRFLDLSGFTRNDLIGHNLFDLVIPEDQRELIRKNITKKQATPYETVLITKEGQRIPIEVEARQTHYQGKDVRVTAIRDIRERKKEEGKRHELEEQLRQKYKMEAVGVMAGGIAHNFNNNLSIILGNVELSQFKLPKDNEINSFLNNAKKAIYNSRDLVSQILSYSRKGVQSKNSIDLALLTDETLDMLRSTIPSSVNLEQVFSQASRNLKINADASQIQETIINLCNNAVHAMEEKGHLKIMLDAVVLKSQDIPSTSSCQPGFFAKLSVQDDGCGMETETLGKIFDPFYTTKAVNEGTGMGLSSVHGIIEQHGGFIQVNSIPDKGSIFDLHIPAKQQTAKQAETEDHKLQRGTGRILFVDDEPMLAELAEDILTELGYNVVVESSGFDALKRIQNKEPFDLLMTDQTMPEMMGNELIQQVRELRPDIPIILCTGYSSKINEAEAKGMGANAFCVKPLDMYELSQKIKETLKD